MIAVSQTVGVRRTGESLLWVATLLLAGACKPVEDDATRPARPEGTSPPSARGVPHLEPPKRIEGEPVFTIVPPDEIPSIDHPRFTGAEPADRFLAPDEPVLGVVGGDGTAKCYSTWQLEAHEIVNDTLDGTPIAAVW